MSYEIILKNYQRGLWSRSMVAMGIRKGIITAEQYKEITGDEYAA